MPRTNFSDKCQVEDDGKILKGAYLQFPTILSLYPRPMVATCHSYCSYCFRWIQFGNPQVQANSSYNDPFAPVKWLRMHPQVSDVMFTGSDPMVLPVGQIKKFVEPI